MADYTNQFLHMRGDAAITILKALHEKLLEAQKFNNMIIETLDRSLDELKNVDNQIGLENTDVVRNMAEQLRQANPDLVGKSDIEVLGLFGIKVD